ncbi:hypothetical protein NQ317_016596 [Molorchus minor]|uniref:Uncharacterized protein n=1 Tax=Molorchus minor TaxID=1323400 RepID=A0ABQ9ISZ5_9CUCU|nr:hypothetical protein NQ317_016596 [Molorchus minor]
MAPYVPLNNHPGGTDRVQSNAIIPVNLACGCIRCVLPSVVCTSQVQAADFACIVKTPTLFTS